MKFKFKIFGRLVSIRTHDKKTNIFSKSKLWSCKIQNWFWLRGVSIHNFIRDECTQDFSCCCWPGDEFAGFAEMLVATAKGVEDGKHSGVLHVLKNKLRSQIGEGE